MKDTGEKAPRPVRSVAEMTAGAITPRRRPENLKELREAAWDEVAEEVLSETPITDGLGRRIP
jgi:hypothetical protein